MGKRFSAPASTKIVSASVLALVLSSCAVLSPNVIEPAAEAPPAPPSNVPGYAGVPHPLGLQMGDVSALFSHPDAPKRESPEMKACADDYAVLEKKTKSRDELKQGILELVRKDPVRYHWCFYGNILELENKMRSAQLLDDRQRTVVDAFRFLAPLSRAFYREFHDSRYLRWAVSYYRKASELAFYRRVEGSPALTEELIGAGKDEVSRGTPEHASSILDKYGITVPGPLFATPQNDPANAGDALPGDAYIRTGSGVIDSVGKAAEVPVETRAPASVPAPDENAGVFPAENADSVPN